MTSIWAIKSSLGRKWYCFFATCCTESIQAGFPPMTRMTGTGLPLIIGTSKVIKGIVGYPARKMHSQVPSPFETVVNWTDLPYNNALFWGWEYNDPCKNRVNFCGFCLGQLLIRWMFCPKKTWPCKMRLDVGCYARWGAGGGAFLGGKHQQWERKKRELNQKKKTKSQVHDGEWWWLLLSSLWWV